MKADFHYIENSKILYYCKIDLEGKYTYVSPYFEKTFECKSEDVIGVPSLDTIYYQDHQKAKDIVVKCFENPNNFQEIILRKPLKNGIIIWTQWEFYLKTDENGQPEEIICFGYNESKNIENLKLLKSVNQKLEDNDIKYKTLFETSGLGIILHSPDGKIIEANEAFCNIVGVDKEKITNHNITEFTPEECWNKDKVFINDLVSKNISFSYEKYLVNNKLEKIPVFVNGKTFFDLEGNVLIWCIIKDITERKNNEQQISDQKSLLEQTAHIVKLGGWEFEIETSKTKWTNEVYDIYDMPQDYDHNLENGLSFYHPDDQNTVANAVNRAIAEGEKFDLEVRFISSKNIHKWLRVIGEPIYKDSKITSVKGVVQDISQRKKSEEIITKQNILLRDISFTQSHTVRLPVANIMGLVDLIDLANTPEERDEIYKKIKHSINDLDLIIREVANKKIID